jgi:ADP-heptose:LPS heptosyltransferase
VIGKKILIFNPFGIGDVLFTTPLIRNLKENLKGASLSYLCNRRVYPLLRSNRFLDNVFIFEKDEWKDTLKKSKLTFVRKAASFFRQIKKEKFDIAFDLSLNSQYGFFLKMAGIKQRIGFNFKQRGRFLTHKIDIPDGYNSWHVARYYLTLLKFLEITPREYNFDLFISQDVYDSARRIFEKNGLKAGSLIIAVCPGSGDSWRSSAYFKRWPEENFLKLCNRLQKELKAKIALFGSNVELSLCDYLYKNLEERPLNLCAKISLEQF